jgi:hypothetical protein
MVSHHTSNHLTANNRSSILNSHMVSNLRTVNSLISSHPMANLNILKVLLHSKGNLLVSKSCLMISYFVMIALFLCKIGYA